MTALLLDASVVLAAFESGNRHHEAARAVMTDGPTTLATLDLARYEAANVAVRAWRELGLVVPLLHALDRIADDGGLVTSSNSLLRDATELADRYAISVYDAAYAAAASLTGRRLVSCDVRDLVSNGLAVLPADAVGAG